MTSRPERPRPPWPYPVATVYLCVMVTVIAGQLVGDDDPTHALAPFRGQSEGNAVSVFADSASWAVILGVLTPLLVSVVQQPSWTPRLRAVVSAVVAVLVGIITVAANGGFAEPQGALASIALVLVASNTAYKTLWKPTGVSPAIEAATASKTQPTPRT